MEKARLALLEQKKAVDAAQYRAVAAAVRGLDDPSPDARVAAAKALKKIGAASGPAVFVIQDKLKDEEDPAVRAAMGQALQTIDPAAAAIIGRESTPAAAPAASALPPN